MKPQEVNRFLRQTRGHFQNSLPTARVFNNKQTKMNHHEGGISNNQCDVIRRRERAPRFFRSLPGISLSRDTGTSTRRHHFLHICVSLCGSYRAWCFRIQILFSGFRIQHTAWCLWSRTFTVEGLPMLRFCRNSSSTLQHRYTGRISKRVRLRAHHVDRIAVRRIGCESAFRA